MFIRVFIAIALPSEIKTIIADLQTQLKTSRADVKWVKPENCHITLKFLGDIKDDQIPEIKETLKRCSHRKPFTLGIGELGAFPTMKRPDIIWIGVKDEAKMLAALAEAVEENLAPLGFPKESRAFTPHITIGRTRPGQHRKTSPLLQNVPVPQGIQLNVNAVTLFQSALTSSGPLYSALSDHPLNF